VKAALPKDDGFAETAEFYSHRPPYATAAIQWIVEQLKLDGRGRLLDIGCGTGHVCIPLASSFAATVGIDSSQPMLDEALLLAANGGVSSIEFRQMSVEELPSNLGAFQLITFGDSFHRVDRERVAATTYSMLEPGGTLVLLFRSTPWRGDSAWSSELRAVIEDWTGHKLGGAFVPSQEVVRRSSFGDCEERDFREARVWTVTQIAGYVKSTSLCSPRVFGARMPDFEHDLIKRLLRIQPDNLFPDVLETTVVVARPKS
jgi:cyclopropane fatty-acyl-phospholipid synthase-like methyltransferase